MRIFSFSIKPKDKEAIDLVEGIKIQSMRDGVKFSFIVVKALAMYKREVLDKGVTSNG